MVFEDRVRCWSAAPDWHTLATEVPEVLRGPKPAPRDDSASMGFGADDACVGQCSSDGLQAGASEGPYLKGRLWIWCPTARRPAPRQTAPKGRDNS